MCVNKAICDNWKCVFLFNTYIYIYTRSICVQQLFRSLRAHQYSSDQKKILKDQSAQTTVRVMSVAYRLWLPFLINRVLNLIGGEFYIIVGEYSKWIRTAWSTQTHWLLWVNRRISINFYYYYYYYYYYYCYYYVSYSLVTTVEVLTPSFIFIIWHHLIMMPRRQGV